MKFGWKTRVGLVLSAVWLCLAFLIADNDHYVGFVLGLGFIPLVILWGIVWAVAGWRAQRPTKLEVPEATVLEAKRKRSNRIRTFITVLVVLAFGLFAATWQFHAADDEAGGSAVSYWFGEWVVYGLFAYVLFRLAPRVPRGFPAVCAAVVVVCGVNYKAHAKITEDRQMLVSLAKATPLLTKLQSGVQVSDEEIKKAQVGVFETILLAQAAYSREVISIADTYTKVVSSLHLERMLEPVSLASPSIRLQTRTQLKTWQQATADYKSQLVAASARGKLGIQAAQLQMPLAWQTGATTGFDNSWARLKAYVDSLVDSEQEATSAIAAILDLMDENSGRYTVAKGPPPTLLFSDEATLARYREFMTAITAASQRETEAQFQVVKAQSELTDKLSNLLKR